MRKWRVGTVSMGLSLILLGIFLFLSLFQGKESFETLIVWWPLILIMLGIEILVYLFLSKQEQPFIKYDLLSIFFVGLIGMIGIAFTVLTSTGLIEKVQYVLAAEEQTFDLPEYVSMDLPSAKIEKVVIDTNQQSVVIESNDASQVHIFGTYRMSAKKDEQGVIQTNKDFVATKQVKDTLYITLKNLPEKLSPFQFYSDINPTIVVPKTVKLEVRGKDNSISLHPGKLQNHWSIENVYEVDVILDDQSDVQVNANMRKEEFNGNVKWDQIESVQAPKSTDSYHDNEVVNGVYKIGSGAYHINIIDGQHVTLNES